MAVRPNRSRCSTSRSPTRSPVACGSRSSAASLNFGDIARTRGGVASVMAEPPFTLGMDVCGVVDAAGDRRRGVDRPPGGRHHEPVARRHGRGRPGRRHCRLRRAARAGRRRHGCVHAAVSRELSGPHTPRHAAGGRAPAGRRRGERGRHGGDPARRGRRRPRHGRSREARKGPALHRPRRRGGHRPAPPTTCSIASWNPPTATVPTSSSTSWVAKAPRRSGRPSPRAAATSRSGSTTIPSRVSLGGRCASVSMGNFSVLGVLLAYMDAPIEFRRFGVNPFPPSVGREVHAQLRRWWRPGRSARSSVVASPWPRWRPLSRTTSSGAPRPNGRRSRPRIAPSSDGLRHAGLTPEEVARGAGARQLMTNCRGSGASASRATAVRCPAGQPP